MTEPALLVRALCIELDSGMPVVEDLDLDLRAGEVLGIVGESGSGKTTTALALLGFTRRGVRISSGTVEIEGSALTAGGERVVRALRGRLVSYVAQDPGAALNPSLRVSDLIGDMLRSHDAGEAAENRVVAALRGVNLPSEPEFARRFPHQLSGGQQQRVAIATALVCGAKVVVLDEPTTGLDVITQARILSEIDRLRFRAACGHGLCVARSRRSVLHRRPGLSYVCGSNYRGRPNGRVGGAASPPLHAWFAVVRA